MSDVRYLPGEDWLSVVRSGVVVMVPVTTAHSVLDRLWNQLGQSPDLQAILRIVAGDFGQSLETMPPFGVVSYAKRLHVLLRGEVHLSIAAGNGDDAAQLSGEHVTTWVERIFDTGAGRFTLRAGTAGAGAGSNDSCLPLEAGIVRAGGVNVGSFRSESARMPGPAPDAGAGPGVEPVSKPAAEPRPTSVTEPVSAVVPVPPVSIAEVAADPERAMTGALEAEEFATINPNLYLTSSGEAPDDGAETGSPAVVPAGQSNDEDTDRDEHQYRAENQTPRENQTQHQEPEQDADLQTTGYDHLWDQTVVRRVEDAAVRPPEEDELPVGAIGENPSAADQDEESDRATTSETEAEDVAAAPSSFAVGGHAPVSSRPPGPFPAPVSSPAPGQLIDSVPWARERPETGEPAAPVVLTPPAAPASLAIVTPAAPADPSIPGTPAPMLDAGPHQSMPDTDDHDGQTVMRSDLNNPAVTHAQFQSDPRPSTGPLVLARLCGENHANPPESPECSVCSQPLDSEPREVRRPSLGTMRISTGEVVDLDQSLIIGRQPSVSRVQGRGMPKLVQVTSAGGDISRSHVEVRLEGWHVLLCDLKATNGTVLIRPAQPPRRLGEGETAFLLDGDVVQLGDDVFLRFEGLR